MATTYKTTLQLRLHDAAYIAGLVDGEGTVGLSRRHAHDQRQLVVSIANTERQILEYVQRAVGAGKITAKCVAKIHHSPSFTFSISNRQALDLLRQVAPFLQSYKAKRAALVIADYVRLTPRNGKYTPELSAATRVRNNIPQPQVCMPRVNRGSTRSQTQSHRAPRTGSLTDWAVSAAAPCTPQRDCLCIVVCAAWVVLKYETNNRSLVCDAASLPPVTQWI